MDYSFVENIAERFAKRLGRRQAKSAVADGVFGGRPAPRIIPASGNTVGRRSKSARFVGFAMVQGNGRAPILSGVAGGDAQSGPAAHRQGSVSSRAVAEGRFDEDLRLTGTARFVLEYLEALAAVGFRQGDSREGELLAGTSDRRPSRPAGCEEGPTRVRRGSLSRWATATRLAPDRRRRGSRPPKSVRRPRARSDGEQQGRRHRPRVFVQFIDDDLA